MAKTQEEALQENGTEETMDMPEIEDITDEHDEDAATLEDRLADLQTKADEYLAGMQRERAEFINYKRRVERERTMLYQNAKHEVIEKFLPALDDFERAVANAPEDVKDSDWVQGILMIERKLYGVIESLGVVEIEALGELFDPNLHEAIAQGESDEYESGHVMDVLQKGYKHGDKVVRPAMVRVAQ
jgi:molecular chaperone GrpE